MKILIRILLFLLALAALLVVVGLMLPSTAHLERELNIDAPPATVFGLLNGFTRTNEWSPWAKIDPDASYEITGPTHGVGAKQAWDSDDPNVGTGSQEITASTPHERVETHLDFGPQGTAEAYFDLTPTETGTHVVWGFDSDFGMNLIGRAFGMTFEKVLGPQYEEGLANLKALAEGLPATDFADLEAEVVEVEAQTILYVSQSTSQDPAEIGPAFAASYGQIQAAMAEHGLEASGPPMSINLLWEDNVYEFEPAMPVMAGSDVEIAADSPVQMKETHAGRALKAVHKGSPEDMEATYNQIEAYLAAHGFEPVGPPWDVWVTDPETTSEEELVSLIYFPLADG